jgi:hypothetical protein
VQALFVGRPAAKASVVRRVSFLDALFGHERGKQSHAKAQRRKVRIETRRFAREVALVT